MVFRGTSIGIFGPPQRNKNNIHTHERVQTSSICYAEIGPSNAYLRQEANQEYHNDSLMLLCWLLLIFFLCSLYFFVKHLISPFNLQIYAFLPKKRHIFAQTCTSLGSVEN